MNQLWIVFLDTVTSELSTSLCVVTCVVGVPHETITNTQNLIQIIVEIRDLEKMNNEVGNYGSAL